MAESDPRQGQETARSQRPWGDIHMVVRNQPCSVDLTTVIPGERSSLHSHNVRSELFHILSEGAYVEIDGEVFRPKPHEEFLIRPDQRHRFWAVEQQFQMLVVSFGHWDVADQIRHADDYDRAGQPVSL